VWEPLLFVRVEILGLPAYGQNRRNALRLPSAGQLDAVLSHAGVGSRTVLDFSFTLGLLV
jgi:hypothetical protein